VRYQSSRVWLHYGYTGRAEGLWRMRRHGLVIVQCTDCVVSFPSLSCVTVSIDRHRDLRGCLWSRNLGILSLYILYWIAEVGCWYWWTARCTDTLDPEQFGPKTFWHHHTVPEVYTQFSNSAMSLVLNCVELSRLPSNIFMLQLKHRQKKGLK